MKYYKLRDMVPIKKIRFFNLVIAGLLLGTALGGLSQSTYAQEADSKSPAVASSAAMVAIEKRVKSLEAQINDLRTMIGTISSLRQRPGRVEEAPFSNPGQRPQSRTVAGPVLGPLPGSAPLPMATPTVPQFGGPAPDPAGRDEPNVSLPPQRPNVREDGFSSGRLASRGGRETSLEPGISRSNEAQPANTQDAQQLYNDAYSHMLRRDYASAEKAFGALLNNHPQSRMAGNAQYWLGETYFVRGKYRPAADAFLKAYRNYSNSVKAPASLMKLALSLNKLGQTSAACKTFDELTSKYPNAPNHVKQRAGMERRRAHCN